MKNKILVVLILGVLSTSVFSCSKTGNEVSQLNSSQPIPSAINVTAQTDKIKFKTDGGSDLYALKPQADGTKLVDGNDKELARIKVDKPGRIKIKNASDKVLGYVVTAKGEWKLESDKNKELYVLKRENDGNYKLQYFGNKEIYRIQTRNNGLEIGTPDNKLVYTVRVKEGKTSLINPNSKTTLYTKFEISPIAFSCLGFDILSREQRAALAYAVNSTGGQ
ncbi:hypothetical protein WKK05_06810 [Nostoc sp. UHCC 0302]|uniref:hypothetical protein n=1 Tax=Nostoc sp. UHCC 0302 TaxID=3134896 RepID=UPI00311C96B6